MDLERRLESALGSAPSTPRDRGSAPSTPLSSGSRGAQPTHLREEHYIVATTFVQANVSNFRELVQLHTGRANGLPPTSPRPEAASCDSEYSSGVTSKEPSPPGPPMAVRRDNSIVRPEVERVLITNYARGPPGLQRTPTGSLMERRMMSNMSPRPELERIVIQKPVGGPGPQRTSTAKLYERRQNAKNLEVKQLMGLSPKRTVSPALSPVSPLTARGDVFSDNSCPTSPLGYMGHGGIPSPAPRPGSARQSPRPVFDLERPPTPSSVVFGFDLNSNFVHLDLKKSDSPREPKLLPLFPLHSPRTLTLGQSTDPL